MKKILFDYKDYKAYLNDHIRKSPHNGRGMRSMLADKIRSQSSYVTKVLNEEAHFSLEQASLINEALAHTEEESRFFLYLVQLARAGNDTVKKFFENEISKILDSRLTIKNRMDAEEGISLLKEKL